jgi:Tfp pilus assembly protein PilP
MKQKFTIALITLFLLSSCSGMRGCGRYADDIARQWGKVDEGLRDVKRYDELARQARQARRLFEAEQYSDEASKAPQRVAAAAQELEQMRQTEHISDDTRNLLQMIEKAGIEAQFISLRTQADDAVVATTQRMKTERGELAKEDIDTLHDFSKDFLCFHLETFANENRLPDDSDYVDFIRNYALARFVPLLEIKGKAESVIAFARNVATPPHSTAEIQARAMLLRECNFR